MIMTLTLGMLAIASGRGFLVRQTREVIDGWIKAWLRTSPPMNPVAPDNMTFIISTWLMKW